MEPAHIKSVNIATSYVQASQKAPPIL